MKKRMEYLFGYQASRISGASLIPVKDAHLSVSPSLSSGFPPPVCPTIPSLKSASKRVDFCYIVHWTDRTALGPKMKTAVAIEWLLSALRYLVLTSSVLRDV